MRLSLGICVTFFCFSILIAFGQKLTPVYENITDGLPSTEVHDMFQDTIGYMWFATDRGICKYDGDRFQTIEIESYLKTKVVFKFFKQKENKVWVVSGKKRLYWFNPFENKPKFHGNEFNDELERILENSRYSRNISTIYFRGDTILVLFRLSPGYIKITPKNGCLLQDGQEDASLKVLFSNRIIIKNTNSFSYVQYSRGLKDTLLRGYVELNKERIPIPKWKVSDNKYDYGVSCELNTPQGRLTAISDLLILSKNGKIESIQLPSQILCMSQVNNNFLIGTYKGIFLVNMNLKILGHFLNPYSITKILKDTDNVYWISTLQNGVYIIPDFNTNEFILPYEFRVSKIFVGSENLFFHDKFKAKAVLYDFEKQTIKEYSDVTLIRDRVKFKDRGLIDLLNLKRKYSFLDETETKNHQFFNESSHDEIFFIESGSIYSYNTPKYRLFFQNKTKHCFKFCFKFNHENLFIGTENGAFFFNLATKKISQYKIFNTQGINFNTYVKLHDRIIFATDKGIYQYHNNRFSHLGKVDENIIELFKKDGKNAWAFSDHHIFKINFEQNNLTLSEFKVDFGKHNSVILSIVEFNSKLWVATKNGVFITDLKTEKYKTESSFFKFKLDSILSKENSIPWDKKLTIYSEDKIQLFFRTISFDRKLKRDLEYSIDGKNWLETNKNSLTLTDLTFGENTLLIRRIDDPKQIIFRMQILVVKHYYETLWFKLLMFIVCSLVITWLVVKVINRREKKKIKELAVLNLELKLLTSKMNPHFTFNTINSIQHFILKNDKKEAILYLSDFALLMRKSLDFSMKERITLEQEKEFLELYVQLENKRFDSNFILECKIETSEISMTTKIPSMLIQPLVENVIIHANYEITEEKKIIISIRLTNGYFIIKVIDFGEGMKTIKEHDNHKSYGLEIIKSRIKLYNGNAYSEEDLMIEPTNKVTKIGTTVIIKLKEWTQ